MAQGWRARPYWYHWKCKLPGCDGEGKCDGGASRKQSLRAHAARCPMRGEEGGVEWELWLSKKTPEEIAASRFKEGGAKTRANNQFREPYKKPKKPCAECGGPRGEKNHYRRKPEGGHALVCSDCVRAPGEREYDPEKQRAAVMARWRKPLDPR